jgi:cytochrome c peroxidase
MVLVLMVLVMCAPALRAGDLEPLGPVPVPDDNPMSVEKVELGRMLFFDRRLSGDGTMSCATCHIPDMAFTDGLDVSLSYPTTKNWRNAPTLINIAYMPSLFHDGRAASLEEQALFPIMSAFEMNQNLDFLEEEINEVPQYVELFRGVFGARPDRQKIAYALAAFQRTLVSRDTPLDHYLKGDKSALSSDASAGLKVFKGKGRCLRCHGGAMLTDGGFHATGLAENPKLASDPRTTTTLRFVAKVSGYEKYEELNEDPGRYLVTKRKKDWKAFRTPSLREAGNTAPYMHNGVFETLEDVIEFYNGGGGEGNKELVPLNLSEREKKVLKIFLTEALSGKPIEVKYPKVP